MTMRLMIIPLLLLLVLGGCRRESTVVTEEVTAAPESTDGRATVPLGRELSPDEVEIQRFDTAWQRVRSIAASRAEASASDLPDGPQVDFVRGEDAAAAESVDDIDPQTIDSLPVMVPMSGKSEGPSVLRAQVLLDRANFSPGVIDGRWGRNTEVAVFFFQKTHGLDTTGEVDERTYRALLRAGGGEPPLQSYRVTQDDLKGPFTVVPEDMYERAKLDCLCYESLLEKLAEKFHATEGMLTRLNPDVDFDRLAAGQNVWTPNVRSPLRDGAPNDVRRIVVSVEGRYLHGFDGSGRLIVHSPTTVGSQYDPSPTETLTIRAIAHDPHFHFQPKLFHERDDDDPEAHLQPGPNSPVGVVWMALSKPHYGIHGTARPETIGYASSAGCIRLPNWEARDLAYRVRPGVQVEFIDT